MKTTIKDNALHIEIPLHALRPSATGKTLTVASSNGNQPTEARINGLPVQAGKKEAATSLSLSCRHITSAAGLEKKPSAQSVPGLATTSFKPLDFRMCL